MHGVLRRQWPGPWLEAQHRRGALQAAPFGAYGLSGTRCCTFLDVSPLCLQKRALIAGQAVGQRYTELIRASLELVDGRILFVRIVVLVLVVVELGTFAKIVIDEFVHAERNYIAVV